MATETESLKFTVDSKGFIDSLKRMERQLQSLADKAGRVSGELVGSFVAIEASAAKLGGAVKKATENVGGAASDFQKLAGGLRGVNRALEVDKVVHFGDAIEYINDALGKASNLRTFTNRMSTLSERLTTMRKEAVEAAKAIDRLAKAAQRELGAARDRKLSPAQVRAQDARAATAELRQQRAEIQLRQQAAREAEESARRIARANQEVGRSARRASTQTVGAFKTIEGTVASLRIKLLNLRTAFAFLGGGFLVKSVLGFAGDFEQRLAEVGTIISDQSEVTLPQYREQLLALSQQGPQDLIDLTESLYQVVSAGIPTIQGAGGAYDVLATAQRAAVAGVSSLKQSTDAVLTALNGFRSESLTATEASDKLFKTVELGRTRFDLLARSVGRVAALADDFGVNSNELLGGLAAITRVIPSTNEAVTQLRALITGIVRPTQRAAETLTLLSDGRQDLQDLLSAKGLQSRGLVGTLKELRDITGGSADAIARLFPNVRALAASAILGGRNFGQFQQLVEGIGNSAGATEKAFGKLQFTFNNVAAVFRNKVATILIRIGDKVMPKLVALFERLGAFLLQNQDRIVKFFEALANILIEIINLIQNNINQILGALAGFGGSKLVGFLVGLLGDVKGLLVGGAEDAGAATKASFLKGLATAGATVAGALAGEAILGVETDVAGEVALQKTQPLVDQQLAAEGGFQSAQAFKDAFNRTISGQGLLADTATLVSASDLEAIAAKLDLKGAIEQATSLGDVFDVLRSVIQTTGSDFETVSAQLKNALSGLDTALAQGGTSAAYSEILTIQEKLAASAEQLTARSPQLAEALRRVSDSAEILTLDEFRKELADLLELAPKAGSELLRLGSRFGRFEEFLPTGKFGDLFTFDPASLTSATDKVFDVLNKKRAEQVALQADFTEKQNEIIAQGLEERQALQREIDQLEEQRARSVALASGGRGATNEQRAEQARLSALIRQRKEELSILEDITAQETKRAEAQEAATNRILDGIDKLIAKLLEEAELLRQQQVVEGKLKKAKDKAQRLRLAEIRDNGLLERIRRRIQDIELEILEIDAKRAEAAEKRRVAAVAAQLQLAKTLGDVQRIDALEEQLLQRKVEEQRLVRQQLASGLSAISQVRESIQVARERVDLERTIANVRLQASKAAIDAENQSANGQQEAAKAARQVSALYSSLAEEAQALVDNRLDDSLRRLLAQRIDQLKEALVNLGAEADENIAELQAAAAVRPSAVREFEQSVGRARLAALEAAQGIENILLDVRNTAQELANTRTQIGILDRAGTISGQLAQTFTRDLDLARSQAEAAAIDAEIARLDAALEISLRQLNDTFQSRRALLQRDIREAERLEREASAVNAGVVPEKLSEETRRLRQELSNLEEQAAATTKQIVAQTDAEKAAAEQRKRETPAQRREREARKQFSESFFELTDAFTFGGASAFRFGNDLVSALSGNAEQAALGLAGVLEALSGILDAVTRKLNQFLPDFSGLIDDVFSSLLQGANSVISGLSRAFTGVFDLLFGGFTGAIESILGFDFFGDQDQQVNPTLPAVNLQGRFFDQRPEDRTRVLDEIRAQGEARRQLEEQNRASNAAQLSPQDLARQTLERAIEAAVRATEVIVEILPELLETFLERVIDLLPTLAGRLAQAVAEGIRILADKFDEILVATLDAISEALPVILAAIGEAIPVIVVQLVAQLPRIVYETLKGLGYGAAGFVGGVFSGIANLFHSGGTVRHNQRNSGLAAAMHAMGAPAFSAGGMVTPGGLTSSLLNRRLQKDEVPAVLQVGERVVSREELARMGGEAALNRLIANGGLGGGESFDGVIQGMSPQAAAVFAAAIRQGMAGLFQNMNQQGYNPNLGARIGRGRGYL